MYLQLSPDRRYTSAVSQQEAGVGVADPGVARADELPEVVSAWRALAASHAAVTAALERGLGERHGLGVSEFEVLERLAEDAEHKFRVQELAESVHLSQRRGVYVCLTEAGRRRHAEALPTQRAVLAAMLDRGRPGGPSA
jgi:hypothetical protein